MNTKFRLPNSSSTAASFPPENPLMPLAMPRQAPACMAKILHNGKARAHQHQQHNTHLEADDKFYLQTTGLTILCIVLYSRKIIHDMKTTAPVKNKPNKTWAISQPNQFAAVPGL